MADVDSFGIEVWNNILDYLNIDQEEFEVSNDFQLFGEQSFLDSIDALEIEIMIKEKYGIIIKTSERNKSTFGNFGILCNFIKQNMNRNLNEIAEKII